MKHTDLAPSVFLLAHDPTTGRPLVGREAVCAAVLLAQLADLMIAGRIVVDAGRVVVTGRRGPPGGGRAAEVAVETLAFQGGGRPGGAWAVAMGDAVYERVADALADAGEVRREQSRRLLGVTHDRFPVVDAWRTDRPRLELANMIRSPRAFDLPGAVAVAALVTMGAAGVFDPPPDRRLCDELVARLPDGLRFLLGAAPDLDPSDLDPSGPDPSGPDPSGPAPSRSVPTRPVLPDHVPSDAARPDAALSDTAPTDPAGPGRFAGSRLLVEGAAMQSRGGRSRPSLAALRHRHDIAAGLVADRSPQEAVPLLEQVVADTAFWWGPTHADALAAEGNLAVAYLAAGRADVGIPLLVSVVAERERLLGADHPATLTAQDVLATVHRTAGRPAEALAHYVQVVARRTRTLGPGHPDTLTSRLGLGLSRADAGDARTAVAVLGGALRDAVAGCGRSHAVTIAVRGALADCLAATGRTEQAATEYGRAVRDAEVGLGPGHRDTVALRAARERLPPSPTALSRR